MYKVKYVPKITRIQVPVYINELRGEVITRTCVSPKVTCEFTGGKQTTVKKLVACIKKQKKALEFCQ